MPNRIAAAAERYVASKHACQRLLRMGRIDNGFQGNSDILQLYRSPSCPDHDKTSGDLATALPRMAGTSLEGIVRFPLLLSPV